MFALSITVYKCEPVITTYRTSELALIALHELGYKRAVLVPAGKHGFIVSGMPITHEATVYTLA